MSYNKRFLKRSEISPTLKGTELLDNQAYTQIICRNYATARHPLTLTYLWKKWTHNHNPKENRKRWQTHARQISHCLVFNSRGSLWQASTQLCGNRFVPPAPSFSMLRQVRYEKVYLPTSTNLLMSLVRSIFTFSLLLKSTPRNHDECGLSLYSGSWQLKVTGFMCTVFIAGLCSRLEIKCRIFDSTSPYHSKWSSGVRATAITTR